MDAWLAQCFGSNDLCDTAKNTLPEYFIIIEIAMIFARANDGYSVLCVQLIGKISIIAQFKTFDESTITINVKISYLMKELLKLKVKLKKKEIKF